MTNELSKLLARPDVKAYLRRPYRVEFRPLELTGGSSRDGKTYYLDPRLKPHRHLVDAVLIHERVEKALRACLGMSYDRAHVLATEAERQQVTSAGRSWDKHKHEVGKIVRADEKRTRVRYPSGFDFGPVNEFRHGHAAHHPH